MPRLEKYVEQEGHYIVTRINDTVITWQLTSAGARKLADAGVVAGQKFERAILLDLIQSGDVYACGGEFPEAVRANQLEMDFAGDPHPESAFPVCDGCRGLTGLHLTLTVRNTDVVAQLQCSACRASATAIPETSVPLALLDRTTLARLADMKGIGPRSENVQRYETLLHTEFTLRWDALRKRRAQSQPALFGEGELGGLGL